MNAEIALAVVVLLLKSLPQVEETGDRKTWQFGIAAQHSWTLLGDSGRKLCLPDWSSLTKKSFSGIVSANVWHVLSIMGCPPDPSPTFHGRMTGP